MLLHRDEPRKRCGGRPLLLSFLLFVVAAPASASLQVQWRNDRLSVVAEKIPLAQLVQAIVQQTGMDIRVGDGWDTLVSVRFEQTPLEDVFQRLFVNSLVVWKSFSGLNQQPILALVSGVKVKHTDVWTWAGEGTSAQAGDTEDECVSEEEESAAHEERLERLYTSARQGDVQALREALADDPDPTVRTTAFKLLVERSREAAVALLANMAQVGPTEKRLQALQLAYQAEQVTPGVTMSILGAALSDEDSSVKGYAIHALAALEGNEAVSYLQQTLHDPDASVRLLAVQEFGRRDDSRLLLQEALGNDDAAVRELASSMLSMPRR